MLGDLGGISAMLYNVSGGVAYYVSLQFVYGSMIKKLFFIHRQPVKASKFGKKELFEFSQIDHLWNNLWCAPFFYLFNGCKKPNTSKVFSQLYDRLMRDICVIDLIKRQNKM